MALRPWWLALLAVFFLLMVGIGSIPGEADALSARYGDKLLHTLAYGFMTALCFNALLAPPVVRAVATVAVIALLGVADEAIQSHLPYRNASLTDWCFDIGAAALVTAVLLLVGRTNLPTEPHAKN